MLCNLWKRSRSLKQNQKSGLYPLLTTEAAVNATGTFRTTTGKNLQLSQFPLWFVKGSSYSAHCNTVCHDCTESSPHTRPQTRLKMTMRTKQWCWTCMHCSTRGCTQPGPAPSSRQHCVIFKLPPTFLLTGSHIFFFFFPLQKAKLKIDHKSPEKNKLKLTSTAEPLNNVCTKLIAAD